MVNFVSGSDGQRRGASVGEQPPQRYPQRLAPAIAIARSARDRVVVLYREWLWDSTEDTSMVVALSAAFAIVLTFFLGVLQAVEWAIHRFVHLRYVGLVIDLPALVFAGVFVSVLVSTYVSLWSERSRRSDGATADRANNRAERRRPPSSPNVEDSAGGRAERQLLLVFLVAASGAVLVPLVALAGLTCSLAARTPSIWTVENAYLWHLADPVPLLHIPATLSWPEPKIASGPYLKIILLLYQLVVIVPFIGVGVAAVPILTEEYRRVTTAREPDRRLLSSWGPFMLALAAVPVVYVGSLLLIKFAGLSGSPIQRYLDKRLPDHVSVRSRHVSLQWVHHAVQLAVGAFLIFVALYVAALTLWAELRYRTWRLARLRSAAVYACLLTLVATAAAAATCCLAQAGISRAAQGRPGRSLNSYFELALWHDARSLPGIDLADDFDWTPELMLTDRWAGLTFLVQLLLTLGIIVIPIRSMLRVDRPVEPSGDTAPAP
jgi:hypothetical protein